MSKTTENKFFFPFFFFFLFFFLFFWVFLYFFGFFLFLFFWIFLFLPPHEDTYLIGLTIHKLPKAGLILFHLGLPLTISTFQLFIFIWAYPQMPALFVFHLDLPLTASTFHFPFGLTSNCHYFLFFIWAYL